MCSTYLSSYSPPSLVKIVQEMTNLQLFNFLLLWFCTADASEKMTWKSPLGILHFNISISCSLFLLSAWGTWYMYENLFFLPQMTQAKLNSAPMTPTTFATVQPSSSSPCFLLLNGANKIGAQPLTMRNIGMRGCKSQSLKWTAPNEKSEKSLYM